MGLVAVPAILGATGLDRGSGTVQSFIQPPTSFQTFNLSQLTGSLQAPDFALTADVTVQPAFAWPARGTITSYMDPTHPMGIDIGLDYDEDSPIMATAAGTVVYAGGSDADPYGYHVQVDHGGGLKTLYAHLSEIFVTQGQSVSQGDLLGYGGSTGKATGKHLHFEVRQGDYLANPLDLLPPAAQKPQQSIVSCESDVLSVERGASAHLDFARTLPSGTRITGATLESTDNAPSSVIPSARLIDGTAIDFATPPVVDATEDDASFTLDLVIGDSPHSEKHCTIAVVAPARALTPYSDASIAETMLPSPFDSFTPAESTPEETYVEPTATAEPTEAPVEATPVPSETPLAVPTGIPMLGELASPTASPTTAPQTPTATPIATVSPTPEATTPAATPEPATATPEATSAAQPNQTPSAQ